MTDHDDQLGTVAEIMRKTDIAVLTYLSTEGALVSTPMGTQDFEEPGTTWFLTEASSDKVRAIEADPRVNVAYSSKAGWVSLSGTATVSRDRDKLHELWDASAGAFMSGGPDDPDNVLLEIDGATAEYWESPGKVTAVVQMAKGLVRDSRPDLGDNDTVLL
ncbi:pyridoxamine 5'-phosphate oxidase family protein [Nocardioides okcheonensis]|uniref:pyridoxamine 5'-phosphate oxidase family protein n=1 Tax=Nocardioides okcheonensis TaxID=2894081 RepID=UPI001E48392C|nr:pyridoxamine 5'-phosphate oxidase family protein [Nocardioides okcheonensis]UFN45046.1 pyridoxamine 5'-phosphate oxidase family protein [Nocardioides okcheonensis]